jgi:hypothetical protein
MVASVPEAASLLFSGGFPRFQPMEALRATQRAVFHVQRELEAAYEAEHPDRFLVLDRGTIDGAAYWPEGPEAFFSAVGTSIDQELMRYDLVIYLESPGEADYLSHKNQNPHRHESWPEAKRLDQATAALWARHPKFTFIANSRSFDRKVLEVLSVISASFPFEK